MQTFDVVDDECNYKRQTQLLMAAACLDRHKQRSHEYDT